LASGTVARVLFVLTGSAGSGKSAALRELAGRRRALLTIDLDDVRLPAEPDKTWWREQVEAQVARAVVAEQEAGRDTALAGWTTLSEVRSFPSSAALEGVAACLLDCDDDVRARRIERRAASGAWASHTADDVSAFLGTAAAMRRDATDEVFRLDTSTLSVSDVADRLETWMDEHHARRRARSGSGSGY
jgi:adenylylsulfate kinase-like enzyme